MGDPSKYQPHRHDMCGTPTWRSWNGMIQRCTNEKAPAWEYYGGRGITVCPQWRDFVAFLADMGIRPEGKTLDRVDPDGSYEPGNCRWATMREQQRNRRDCNTFTLGGVTLTLQEWAERTGIAYEALRGRYRRNWPADKALSMPVSKSNSVLRTQRTYRRDTAGQFAGGAI